MGSLKDALEILDRLWPSTVELKERCKGLEEDVKSLAGEVKRNTESLETLWRAVDAKHGEHGERLAKTEEAARTFERDIRVIEKRIEDTREENEKRIAALKKVLLDLAQGATGTCEEGAAPCPESLASSDGEVRPKESLRLPEGKE